MKDEVGEIIKKRFFWLRAKTYRYLIEDGSEDTKAKSTKKCHKKILDLKITKTV